MRQSRIEVCTIEDRGAMIEDRGATIEDHGAVAFLFTTAFHKHTYNRQV